MNKSKLYFFILVISLPIIGCQKNYQTIEDVDNISYIKEFELLQKNSDNKNTIKITSPKASLDPVKNLIEISSGSIQISNNKGNDLLIKSGMSVIDNTNKFIKIYDNVNISFFDTNNYTLYTKSVNWDLNKSNIDLNSSLYIDFDKSKIISENGTYNLNSTILKLYNNKFNRSIFSMNGAEKYQIEIVSDIAKWIKKNNSIEFTSNDKQVETTINILSIK